MNNPSLLGEFDRARKRWERAYVLHFQHTQPGIRYSNKRRAKYWQRQCEKRFDKWAKLALHFGAHAVHIRHHDTTRWATK